MARFAAAAAPGGVPGAAQGGPALLLRAARPRGRAQSGVGRDRLRRPARHASRGPTASPLAHRGGPRLKARLRCCDRRLGSRRRSRRRRAGERRSRRRRGRVRWLLRRRGFRRQRVQGADRLLHGLPECHPRSERGPDRRLLPGWGHGGQLLHRVSDARRGARGVGESRSAGLHLPRLHREPRRGLGAAGSARSTTSPRPASESSRRGASSWAGTWTRCRARCATAPRDGSAGTAASAVAWGPSNRWSRPGSSTPGPRGRG